MGPARGYNEVHKRRGGATAHISERYNSGDKSDCAREAEFLQSHRCNVRRALVKISAAPARAAITVKAGK